MAQPEIIQFLKARKGKKYTAGEIAVFLGVSSGSITANLKKMRNLRFNELAWTKEKDRTNRQIFLYSYGGNNYVKAESE